MQHRCLAWTRKCFDCGQYGHYRKTPVCPHQNKSNNSKTERRRQKDLDRLLTFQARKQTLVEMPFHNEEDSVVVNFLPSQASFQHINAMQISYLKNENITTGEILHDITNSYINVQKEVRKLNKSLEKSSKEKSELKTEIHDQAMKAEYLTAVMEKCQQFYNKITRENQLLKDEIITKTNKSYRQNKHQRSDAAKYFFCGRCGSNQYHNSLNCLAKGNMCSTCGRPNHFMIMCRKSEEDSFITQGLTNVCVKFYVYHKQNPTIDSENNWISELPTSKIEKARWEGLPSPFHLNQQGFRQCHLHNCAASSVGNILNSRDDCLSGRGNVSQGLNLNLF